MVDIVIHVSPGRTVNNDYPASDRKLEIDWLRKIPYAAILCFLTNLIFLIYPLYVPNRSHITFLNPVHVTLHGILIMTSYGSKC